MWYDLLSTLPFCPCCPDTHCSVRTEQVLVLIPALSDGLYCLVTWYGGGLNCFRNLQSPLSVPSWIASSWKSVYSVQMFGWCNKQNSKISTEPELMLFLTQVLNNIRHTCGGSDIWLAPTHSFNPFTPESDQCQISPAASPEILHHTVRRTWLFIACSDERWL